MATMNAVQIDNFGGPEVLHLRRLPIPQPRQGEYLVKIRAASVNPVDYKIRSGKYPEVKAEMLPYILGRDLAGEVVEAGAGADKFRAGDQIYALLGIDRGAYGEYAIVKETEAARSPKSLKLEIAAAVPLAALTAWQGLFRYGNLRPGQAVLIHAGSGGVGHFAIQFAKAKGAFVATTVSAEHADFVKTLGADQVIDYKQQRFENEIQDVDMVFDLIGGETQDRSWGVLRHGGIMVSTLSRPSPEKADKYGVRAMRYTAAASSSELAEIAELIDAGKVKPVVSKTFGLQDAAAAGSYIQQGHTQGKVVLSVGQGSTMETTFI